MAFESVKEFASGKAFDHVSEQRVDTFALEIDVLIAGQVGGLGTVCSRLPSSFARIRSSVLISLNFWFRGRRGRQDTRKC